MAHGSNQARSLGKYGFLASPAGLIPFPPAPEKFGTDVTDGNEELITTPEPSRVEELPQPPGSTPSDDLDTVLADIFASEGYNYYRAREKTCQARLIRDGLGSTLEEIIDGDQASIEGILVEPAGARISEKK